MKIYNNTGWVILAVVLLLSMAAVGGFRLHQIEDTGQFGQVVKSQGGAGLVFADDANTDDQQMTYDAATGILSLDNSPGVELDDYFYPRGQAAWYYNPRTKNGLINPDIQNYLYAADDWAIINLSHPPNLGGIGNIFQGNFDSRAGWNQGQAVTLEIDLDGKGRMTSLTYGHGVFYVTMYGDMDKVGEITLRVESDNPSFNTPQTVIGELVDAGEATFSEIIYKFVLVAGPGTIFTERYILNFTARTGSETAIAEIMFVPDRGWDGAIYRQGKDNFSWDQMTFYNLSNVEQVKINPKGSRSITSRTIKLESIYDNNDFIGTNGQILINSASSRIVWGSPGNLVVNNPGGGTGTLNSVLSSVNDNGDNLGDHTATQNLLMGGNIIQRTAASEESIRLTSEAVVFTGDFGGNYAVWAFSNHLDMPKVPNASNFPTTDRGMKVFWKEDEVVDGEDRNRLYIHTEEDRTANTSGDAKTYKFVTEQDFVYRSSMRTADILRSSGSFDTQLRTDIPFAGTYKVHLHLVFRATIAGGGVGWQVAAANLVGANSYFTRQDQYAETSPWTTLTFLNAAGNVVDTNVAADYTGVLEFSAPTTVNITTGTNGVGNATYAKGCHFTFTKID
jgi:hypothetical protein